MKKKSKNKGIGGVFHQAVMNTTQSKGNLKMSATKGVVDVLTILAGITAASAAGPAIGFFGGLGLLGLSHYYIDDKTGLIRIGSASMVGYSIAKFAKDVIAGMNKSTDATIESTVKSRLGDLKEELIAAFHINKLFKKEGDQNLKGFGGDDEQFGDIDLTALDMFENFNEREAREFSQKQITGSPDMDGLNDDSMGFAYSIIDEDYQE